MDDLEQKIFKIYVDGETSLCMCMHAPDMYISSIGDIAKELNISKYKAGKAIHGLVSKGLLERKSLGCPAEVAYYGEGEPELIDDAHPPINGFVLTKKATETETFKEAGKKFDEDLAKWMEENVQNGKEYENE